MGDQTLNILIIKLLYIGYQYFPCFFHNIICWQLTVHLKKDEMKYIKKCIHELKILIHILMIKCKIQYNI